MEYRNNINSLEQQVWVIKGKTGKSCQFKEKNGGLNAYEEKEIFAQLVSV